MYVYVILSSNSGPTEIERFSEEKWNSVKPRLNPVRIIHVSPDLNDPAFNDFTEIVWDRVFNPVNKLYEKIRIPFTKDFEQMDKAASEKTEEKMCKINRLYDAMMEAREIKKNKRRQKQLESGNIEELNQRKAFINSQIAMDLSEMDAIAVWKNLDFFMPAGDRIEQIKESYHMSWSRFEQFVRNRLMV